MHEVGSTDPVDSGRRMVARALQAEERELRHAARGSSKGAKGQRVYLPIERVKHAGKRLRKLIVDLKLGHAYECTAYILGFKSWNELMHDEERHLKLSAFDDELTADELEPRRGFQALRVHEWLDLDKQKSRLLIELVRPSGRDLKLRSDASDNGVTGDEEQEDERVWRRLNQGQ